MSNRDGDRGGRGGSGGFGGRGGERGSGGGRNGGMPFLARDKVRSHNSHVSVFREERLATEKPPQRTRGKEGRVDCFFFACG
jgi:hypothetical protein